MLFVTSFEGGVGHVVNRDGRAIFIVGVGAPGLIGTEVNNRNRYSVPIFGGI